MFTLAWSFRLHPLLRASTSKSRRCGKQHPSLLGLTYFRVHPRALSLEAKNRLSAEFPSSPSFQGAPFMVVLFRSSSISTYPYVCSALMFVVRSRMFSLMNIIKFLANRNRPVMKAPLRKRCATVLNELRFFLYIFSHRVLLLDRFTSACPGSTTGRSDAARVSTSHAKSQQMNWNGNDCILCSFGVTMCWGGMVVASTAIKLNQVERSESVQQ